MKFVLNAYLYLDHYFLAMISSKTLVAQEGPFKIWIQKGVPSFILQHMKTVLFGTEGAIYEHTGTEAHIQEMPNAFIVWASKEEDLVACMLMNKVETYLLGDKLPTYYIRYFSAHPKYKGKGLTKKLSIIFIEQFRAFIEGKAIFFAALEDGNYRSIKIVDQLGFKKMCNMQTIGFSRLFPEKNSRIEAITSDLIPEMGQKLDSFYKNYSLFHKDHIFKKNQYFIIRDKGEIVAGVQMHKTVWKIKSMPGLSGWLLLKVLPHLPLFNKMIHPKHFEFLSFEGIYFKEGKEDLIFELMEGLLAQEALKVAIFWLAENAPLYKIIIQKGRLGIIHQFVKSSNAYLVFDPKYLEEKEQKALLNQASYISTFDFL